jgi:N-acetylneuraminic acid mutarotase
MRLRVPDSAACVLKRWFEISTLAVLLCFPHTILAQGNGWILKSSMPIPRDEHASCAIDRYVYVFGGAEEHFADSRILASSDRYDTVTDTWESRMAMPSARQGQAASVVDGKCYVIGGQGGQDSSDVSSVEMYDPATNQWTARTNMPTPRHGAASAVIDGVIYVVGGSPYLKTLEAYNPATDTWSSLAPMTTGRIASTASAVGGKLYVMGGNKGFFDSVNTVEVYDPKSNSWSTAAPMPQPLFYLSSSVVDGKIYAIGGAPTTSSVNVYDPLVDRWTPSEALLDVRNRHTSEVINGEIFVFGGARVTTGTPHMTTDTVEARQIGERPLSINVGHAGAWFDPETPGQGQLIDIEPESKYLFLSWFTFTDASSANPNEQHWFTAQGNYSGDTADLVVYETLGGRFDDPQEVSTEAVGSAALSFSDCNRGQLDYTIDSWNLEGSFPLQRAIPGAENVCQERAGQSTEPLEQNDGRDGAWFDAATPGQGFLIDAHPDDEFIFVAWFTYGDDTASGQRWLTAQGPLQGSNADVVVYETLGGSFDKPGPSETNAVGTMTIDFTNCSNALLSYSIPDEELAGMINIERAIPGTEGLCEELSQ